ncbi:dihydropteroate synthase [Haloechinothrix sp. LS1_15]|uniref:dihydropteroate synthase n=1 Tax=Haloechinothrix sp. LS1_15 TaxID=2652248 RepID=UPI002944421D|nr:dihydropteroate synthase [Haloechinothrix sp. LS1_15]MDV6011424.1 dihydropteroate synthase [Haloechinothrix sp. LS1_15]
MSVLAFTARAGVPRREDRCAVVGVLNVTPDSFSDGGRYFHIDDAVRHAQVMYARGADLIDVGGESTRPGADRVPADKEIERVLPVIESLAADGIALSVDTTRAAVAEAAISAGAVVINDVSGGLADPNMVKVAAATGAPFVLMHWRGHSKEMDTLASYTDVVGEVRDELLARVDAAVAAGVAPESIVLDPGIGFAKRAEHNWELLRHTGTLAAEGFPVLVGASRKRFLGALLADEHGRPRDPDGREVATAAISALVARAGAWGVRVHEVGASVDAVTVAAAMAGES